MLRASEVGGAPLAHGSDPWGFAAVVVRLPDGFGLGFRRHLVALGEVAEQCAAPLLALVLSSQASSSHETALALATFETLTLGYQQSPALFLSLIPPLTRVLDSVIHASAYPLYC